MENLSNNKKNDVLPEFQSFLLAKKLVPEKNVFFYAIWVSRYLTYARKMDIQSDQYHETEVLEFIESLKADPKISDWQIRQAGDAIRLYYYHYLNLQLDNLSAIKAPGDPKELLGETKRLIRLKHYSYSTEKTYLQWIRRFLEYLQQTSKIDAFSELGGDDCKNFLSHLALKEKVSASTQNQAFNALLFLFRNVLCQEMGSIAQTVRAKRGQKLPVVFSVEEVKRLLACLSGRDLLIAGLLYGSGIN